MFKLLLINAIKNVIHYNTYMYNVYLRQPLDGNIFIIIRCYVTKCHYSTSLCAKQTLKFYVSAVSIFLNKPCVYFSFFSEKRVVIKKFPKRKKGVGTFYYQQTQGIQRSKEYIFQFLILYVETLKSYRVTCIQKAKQTYRETTLRALS